MKDSSDSSSQVKTEPPSQKRLRDLRRRGDVARSPDIAATVAIICGCAFLAIQGTAMLDRLQHLLHSAVRADFTALEDAQLLQWLRTQSAELFWVTLPIIVTLVTVAAITAFLQVGPVFATSQVKPQLSRINPISGFKRVFSMRTVVELAKLIVKTSVLAAVIWFVTRDTLPALLQSHWVPPAGILPLALDSFAILCWWAIVAFVAIAAFDLWYQGWSFRRRNRMSIEELRREHKETEGDPHVRGRRRQLHREVADAAMLDRVRRASVVVVNPTHIAVALYYRAGETDLPVVVAKGEGHVAQSIRRVAEQEGIPIMHDVDLARRLRTDAQLNQYIPEELIEPVAAVLRWARDLQRP